MVKSVLHACYIIIFTLFVDQGDGHWKENDRENLRRDIDSYRRMSEKIERELKAFYDEYPEEQIQDNVDSLHYKHKLNTIERVSEATSVNTIKKEPNNATPVINANNVTSKPKEDIVKPSERNNLTIAIEEIKWPKFEEILLAMGKKYDWKNDRWIKVKDKIKNIDENYKNRSKDNEINISHEKHKFYYKFVKLNRSKNRRSVVVAVSAVR